jgi:hypothetical protein
MSFLLLALITMFVVLGTASLVIAYGAPHNAGDTALKVGIFWGGLYLFCVLITALTTFTGVIFRELIGVLAVSVSILVIAWFARLQYIYAAVGKLELLNPVVQYVRLSAPTADIDIFNPYGGHFAFGEWLGMAFPVLTLIIAEIAIFFAASCLLFKEEEK